MLEYMTRQGEDIEEAVKVWSADKSPDNLNTVAEVASGYVTGIVSRVSSPPGILSYDDLFQCGMLGLLSALKRYDSTSDTLFRTWAYPRIRGSMLDAIRKASSTSRGRSSPMVPLETIDFVLASPEAEPADINGLSVHEASRTLVAALRELPTRQRTIIVFMLNGLKPKHLSSLLGISTTMIQLERKNAVEALSAVLVDNTDATVSDLIE